VSDNTFRTRAASTQRGWLAEVWPARTRGPDRCGHRDVLPFRPCALRSLRTVGLILDPLILQFRV